MTERSFRDAYSVLQRHAETLRDQSEPNIDDLLTIVTESVEAYRVCKARIDAVEAALKAALDGTGAEPVQAGKNTEKSIDAALPTSTLHTRGARTPLSHAPPESGDDDIPF